MERLILKYKDAQNSLETLRSILTEPFSIIIRDATVQRFEYTFEAFWKFIQEYLKEKEGIIANSPKGCFKEIFSIGFSSEDETVQLLEMTDKRNETSHTYKEKVAQGIFERVNGYAIIMAIILEKLKDKIS